MEVVTHEKLETMDCPHGSDDHDSSDGSGLYRFAEEDLRRG
jgi:hypothetical protein